MKVVLTRDVKDVGAAGQVREVADGYARNFLFPRKLAVPATSGALKVVEQREQAESRRVDQQERQARTIAERLKNEPLTIFPRVGEQDRLYGSVTASDIAEALSKLLGQPVDRRKIELEEPLKTLGDFRVPYRLTRNVTATITVKLERADPRA